MPCWGLGNLWIADPTSSNPPPPPRGWEQMADLTLANLPPPALLPRVQFKSAQNGPKPQSTTGKVSFHDCLCANQSVGQCTTLHSTESGMHGH